MAAPVPKVLSPQAHRRFDLLALPGILAAAAWMSRRDRPAAALMLMVAAGEGTAMLTTDYPPPVLARWMGFRQHVQAANAHGAFIAALALLVPGVQPRHRPLLLGLAAVPWVLNALSDTRESEWQRRLGRGGRTGSRLASSAPRR
jgi:hypothetical protein